MMITLKKAMEILDLNIRESQKNIPPDVLDTLKLGFEALKAWDRLRKGGAGVYNALLPGETKE